jgi:hypothetical protein
MNTFIEKQYKVYKAKNALYGNSFAESLNKWGNIAFAVRIEDKINRIKQLTSSNILDEELLIVNNESLLDTVKDLFNYCSMFFSYYSGKEVIDCMREIYVDKNLLKMILFKRYGDNQKYILDSDREDDVVLFDKIVSLLCKIIIIEEEG